MHFWLIVFQFLSGQTKHRHTDTHTYTHRHTHAHGQTPPKQYLLRTAYLLRRQNIVNLVISKFDSLHSGGTVSYITAYATDYVMGQLGVVCGDGRHSQEIIITLCFNLVKVIQGKHKKYPPTTFVDISAMMREDFCMKFYTTVKQSHIHFITN